MKKFAACILTLLLCCTLVCAPADAAGFEVPPEVSVTAASAYFVNLDTGVVVVNQNSRERRSVASLTKLMTCLLLIENVPDLANTMVTAPVEIYVSPVTDASSSTADIRPGETVSALTLLYAMLLPSGNEAAAITAYYVGNGSMENFYAMMNARAAELGCADTNFTCAHGLLGIDEGNYSCAYDLFLIAQACWQHDSFRTVCTASSYDMPFTDYHTAPENADNPNAAYTIYTTVKMQVENSSVYRSYIRGIKTGSTYDAGRNYVSGAVNDNGESFIGVVLGCPWEPAEDGYAYSFHDTANLYDWIFSSFSVRSTLDVASPITEVPVQLSSEMDTVKAYPAQDLQTFLPNGDDSALSTAFDTPEALMAPLQAGDKLGTVTVSVNGEAIGTVDLVAAQNVKRNPVLYALYLLKLFFTSTYFHVVLILTAIFFLCYFGIVFYVRAEQRKRKTSARRRIRHGDASLRSNAPSRRVPGSAARSVSRSAAPQSRPVSGQSGRPAQRPAAQSGLGAAANSSLPGAASPQNRRFSNPYVQSGTEPESPPPNPRR